MTIAQDKAQIEADIRRQHEQQLADRRKLCEWVGLPLICAEAACRRAGCCAGAPDPRTVSVPPCHEHYRQEMGFLLFGPDRLFEHLMELKEREEREACSSGRDLPVPKPASGRAWTLLEYLYGRDSEALERLRRPRDVSAPGGWENDPEAFKRYMEAGDWRDPGDLAGRSPSTITGVGSRERRLP